MDGIVVCIFVALLLVKDDSNTIDWNSLAIKRRFNGGNVAEMWRKQNASPGGLAKSGGLVVIARQQVF